MVDPDRLPERGLRAGQVPSLEGLVPLLEEVMGPHGERLEARDQRVRKRREDRAPHRQVPASS
jgi:hypothetical protein